MPKQAFRIEIARTITKQQWIQVCVWADDADQAAELAKPLADKANASAEYDCPFSYDDHDEGETEGWEVRPDNIEVCDDPDSFLDEETIGEPDENDCTECGDPSDGGEGWDGLCGACADKAEEA